MGNMGSAPAPGMSSSGSAAPMEEHLLMGAKSDFLGGDAGDVKYAFHLINGKNSAAPELLHASAGQVIRLRLINAASDTAYRIGLLAQKITVTHTDGFPVVHKEVDAVVLGMGERVDALFTVAEGNALLLALAEGKGQSVHALLSTGIAAATAPAAIPTSITGTVIDAGMLKADPSVQLPGKKADRTHRVALTGGMQKYDWSINGNRFDPQNPLANAFDLKLGERIQVDFVNETQMWHPMHLHGHTFQVGTDGARKDTVIVRPQQTVSVFFDADNPGQWLFHCHNAYHAQRGMMGVFSYLK